MADDEADLSGDQAAAEAAAYSRAGSCAPSGLSGIDCDSGSEDEQPVEEFALDEQEQADTTARQHAEEGKDLQGIPWERLQVCGVVQCSIDSSKCSGRGSCQGV